MLIAGNYPAFVFYRVIVARLFTPHECCLEFRELIGSQFVPGQDQADNVLWQKGEATQVQHLCSMFVHEFQHLLHKALGALVLNVPLGRGQEGTDRVDIDTALHEPGTRASQFLEPVVIGCIHDAQQCSRLQSDAPSVDVFDELAEHVRLKLFDYQGLVLLTRGL